MIDSLIKKIEKKSNFLIIPSRPLDLDSIASSIALKLFLERNSSKKASIIVFSEIPAYLNDFEGIGYVNREFVNSFDFTKYDLIFLIDGNEWTQFFTFSYSNIENSIDKQKIINIDHHQSGTIERDLPEQTYRKVECSTGKVLFDTVMQSKIESEEIARFLMYSLVSDTDNFTHSIYPGTFAFAETLMISNLDYYQISEQLFSQKSFEFLIWLAGKVKFLPEKKLCAIVITKEDESNIEKKFGDGWLKEKLDETFKKIFGGKIKGYPVFVLIRDDNNGKNARVSFRISNLCKIDLIKKLSEEGHFATGHQKAGVAHLEMGAESALEYIIKLLS